MTYQGPTWVYAKDMRPGMVIATQHGDLAIATVEPEAGRVRLTMETGYSFLSVPLAGSYVA